MADIYYPDYESNFEPSYHRRGWSKLFADLLLAIMMLGFVNYVYNTPQFQEQLFSLETSVRGEQLQQPQNITAAATAAVSKISPSVVSIYGYQNVSQSITSTLAVTKVIAGTGFFIRADGYIVTNKHVVAGENYTYFVVLANGRKHQAEIVYRDPTNDVALIKIPGSGYSAANIGDSSHLKIGQTVLGVGNDFGKDLKVSEGQISGLHKTLLSSGDQPQTLSDVIQTTAQLYPGDSGGPLFDLNGTVIGINVATAEQRGNTSFSIPISDVWQLIQANMTG